MSENKKRHLPVNIQFQDMPEEMMERALKYAEDSIQKFSLEIDMAFYIKRLFDKKYEASWHVVVGKTYSSFVTAEENNMAYF